MNKQLKEYVPSSIIKGINDNYHKSQSAAKSAIEYAIKTGEFLLKAKEKVPHGQWGDWLQSNASGTVFSTQDHASKYMRLAKNKELVSVVDSGNPVFNLTEVNKAIANATEEEKAEAERLRKELAEQEEIKKKEVEERKRKKELERAARVADDARQPVADVKPEPVVVETEVETSEIVEKYRKLEQEHQQLVSEFEETLADNESMGKVFDSNDQLKEALDENKKLREINRVLNDRLNALVGEKAAAIRQVKYWKDEFLKLQKMVGIKNN